MEFSLKSIFAAVLYTECFAGITANMIIVAANIKKWKSLKSLNTCDTVLSFLAVSRVLYLLSIVLFLMVVLFYQQLFLNLIFLTTAMVVTMSLNSTNLWFATVLCVLYCMKITNYSWKFFIFLKTKINALVPWFLLASLLISVASSLPFGWCVYSVKNLTHASNENSTSFISALNMVANFHNQFLIVFLGSFAPFMTFCVANFLLIHSLRMHTRRMRSSGSTPNLESHCRAVKSMSLFLVLHLMFFICMNITMSGSLNNYKVWFWFNNIITCCPPFIHSLYVICSSGDLQKLFISLFYRV